MGLGFAWPGKTGAWGAVELSGGPVLGGGAMPGAGGPGFAVLPKALDTTPVRTGATMEAVRLIGGAVLGLGLGAILFKFLRPSYGLRTMLDIK